MSSLWKVNDDNEWSLDGGSRGVGGVGAKVTGEVIPEDRGVEIEGTISDFEPFGFRGRGATGKSNDIGRASRMGGGVNG